MTQLKASICVAGAGSWGTALAILLAKNGHKVWLWGRHAEQIRDMQEYRFNKRYLPDNLFPDNLCATTNMQEAAATADQILLVVPAKNYRSVLQQLKPHVKQYAGIASASKGLEPKTFNLLDQLIREELGAQRNIAIISGPTFAQEVANGLPTAITVASANLRYATQFATLLHNDTFRVYTSSDTAGVQVGGAVKNVLAIAAGIADGMELGANSRAALITRGLSEVTRLGIALGGEHETFMGLTGLGDIVLTCTDNQSRNRRVGLALAEGKNLDAILQDLGQVAEGVYTTQEVHRLAKKLGVDMPITEHVYRIIYENEDPRLAVKSLLTRAIRSELD